MPSPPAQPATEPDESNAIADPGSIYDVAVLQKALDLLEAVTDAGDLGLAELSARTGASKASAFRVLTTLHRRGYVSKDPVTRHYTPGPRLIALSFANVSKLQLVPRARPVLEELRDAFGETVNLGILADHDVLYLEIAESARSLRMSSATGSRDRLHSTSLGKAILACLPADEARALLEAYDRKPATRRTIVDIEALMAELRATRDRGYSIDDEENEVGARCVGVAITDVASRPQAAISISGPAARVFDSTIDAIGERLKDAAEEVAELMGWRPTTIPDRRTRGAGARGVTAPGGDPEFERFVAAQDAPPAGCEGYEAACAELRAGHKRGHWIWWVVPQLRGLGSSDFATFYGLASLAEAQAYLSHPVLGSRLLTVVDLLLASPAPDARTILGEVDARKLGSSMTLVGRAAPDEPRFRAVLDRWFAGEEDSATLRVLGSDAPITRT